MNVKFLSVKPKLDSVWILRVENAKKMVELWGPRQNALK